MEERVGVRVEGRRGGGSGGRAHGCDRGLRLGLGGHLAGLLPTTTAAAAAGTGIWPEGHRQDRR